MIGMKFTTKHGSMVEAISEPYQKIKKDFPQGVETLEYETCIVIKWLNSNEVAEVEIDYLKEAFTEELV